MDYTNVVVVLVGSVVWSYVYMWVGSLVICGHCWTFAVMWEVKLGANARPLEKASRVGISWSSLA